VAEAIHCPSCTTRYRLRPERLKPVIRRAKCHSCGSVFPVGDIVGRLLAFPAQDAPGESAIEDGQAAQPAFPAPRDTPSLTLGDLDGADAEVLDKTLVAIPSFLPETKPQAAPESVPPDLAAPTPTYPPEITESTLSGYTSARDAIDKLFGEAPPSPTRLTINRDSEAMDMEATLSALDTTLSGTSTHPPTDHTETQDDTPTAAGVTEAELTGPSISTMRLSREDLQAAMAAQPPAPAEPTVALRASNLMTAGGGRTGGLQPFPTTRSFAPPSDASEAGAEMLRLRIGETIYGGLTMPQLIAWVEEGRILENHLVARQQSENWLEAHKVPGLRPVFEHIRRERSGVAASPDSDLGDIAPKKSLFGGLFGKN
jgi:predicted Zn finger-like uncharacterized protein